MTEQLITGTDAVGSTEDIIGVSARLRNVLDSLPYKGEVDPVRALAMAKADMDDLRSSDLERMLIGSHVRIYTDQKKSNNAKTHGENLVSDFGACSYELVIDDPNHDYGKYYEYTSNGIVNLTY